MRTWPLIVLVGMSLFGCSGKRPDFDLTGNRLPPCPDSPNCVSSQAPDEGHRVEPLAFEGDPAAAWDRLASVVRDMPRTEIVQDTGDWIHATFTSKIFRFVDDALFHLSPEDRRIHVRSASRVGYSDLGANRKRVEDIRSAFEKAKATAHPE
jgi:uncharacterized protein (DUF1499 family)